MSHVNTGKWDPTFSGAQFAMAQFTTKATYHAPEPRVKFSTEESGKLGWGKLGSTFSQGLICRGPICLEPVEMAWDLWEQFFCSCLKRWETEEEEKPDGMMMGGWWVSIKYCQNHYLLSAGLPAPNYLLSASLHCQLQIPKIQSFSQNWGNFGCWWWSDDLYGYF